MKTYAGVDIWINVFLISTPVSSECQRHAPAALPSENSHGTHWIRGWAGPGTGLDDMEKEKFPLPGHQLRPLGRLARSQSLFFKFKFI
jgi:hypothetical protein